MIDYLGKIDRIVFPTVALTSCIIRTIIVFTSALWGVLLILAMTFDRFYGIVRPHLAASINNVTKARATCVFIIVFGTIYNVPHVFLTASAGYDWVPYGKVTEFKFGELFYWLSFVVNYTFPFVSLLIMNSFIIQTIRSRKNLTVASQTEQRTKSSDTQIFIILLLVTFSFLLLTAPAYMLFLFNMIVDFNQSPRYQAGSKLFYSLAQKTWYTNNGINFFLYNLSGTKFRNDLRRLFGCNNEGDSLNIQRMNASNSMSTSLSTADTDWVPNSCLIYMWSIW